MPGSSPLERADKAVAIADQQGREILGQDLAEQPRSLLDE
jgi:hypothetical protein